MGRSERASAYRHPQWPARLLTHPLRRGWPQSGRRSTWAAGVFTMGCCAYLQFTGRNVPLGSRRQCGLWDAVTRGSAGISAQRKQRRRRLGRWLIFAHRQACHFGQDFSTTCYDIPRGCAGWRTRGGNQHWPASGTLLPRPAPVADCKGSSPRAGRRRAPSWRQPGGSAGGFGEKGTSARPDRRSGTRSFKAAPADRIRPTR